MSQFGRHGAGHGSDAAREALALRKQRRRKLSREQFEALDRGAVHDFAAVESKEIPKHLPAYYERPWSQLRDEMTARNVQKVGELPPERIKTYRRTTRWVPRFEGAMYALAGKGYRPGGSYLLGNILFRPFLVSLARAPERQKNT